MTQDAVIYINIAGVDYLCREHVYAASVLKLADAFSVTIPAPDGQVIAVDGSKTPVENVATMCADVTIDVADPNVDGGQRVTKLRGVVTGRRVSSDNSSGTVLAVTGADKGWWLTSCGQVFRNLRGVKWQKFFQKNLGITVDAAGNVTADAFGWGFKGVRAGNVLNRRLRLGRQAAQSDFQQDVAPTPVEPVFQIEVGQTLDGLMIQYAKIDHLLVNVSTDAYLQIFRPDYAQQSRYTFNHHPASDSRSRDNNVIGPSLEESADGYYSVVECWSTVIDTTDNDPTNPNAGRYHGRYPLHGESDLIPHHRLYTFTDTEQMSQERVNQRAKWQWQRFQFDGWTYTFETVGHSQNGVPYVEDTMCELHDSVYGLDGLYYVSAVEYRRKLARPGFDRGGAGTRCKITLKKPNLLGA
jgi:hypothetical protein